jgi:predicted O-methyltransferase YrrM
LELLTRLIGGRRVFEFGSGWGYSAYWFARAVGAGGEVLGSEKDDHELEAFDRLWGDHPHRDRVHIGYGDAFEIFERTEGTFDVVFLDIFKPAYPAAIEVAVPRIRPGGLLLADNVLWGGKTSRPADKDDASTRALQAYNRRAHEHPRLQTVILPACDGLSVSRVR